MKVIITGASGLLGRAMVSEFSRNSWDVLGLAFSRAKDNLVKVDLNDFDKVKKIVSDFSPLAVVHCAAERSPENVEKNFDASQKLNVSSSENLAKLADEVHSTFIYISTDYVFDGSNPPYSENDTPNPLNKYGLLKLQGEKAVLKVNPNSYILRIPILYGGEEYLEESAVSCLIKNLLTTNPVKVSNYETRFPSHTDDIAIICQQLVKQICMGVICEGGIYHWCGSEPLTKFQMVKTIASVFGLPYDHLTPDNNPSSGAPRPRNTQLSCFQLEARGIRQHTPFKDGVRKSFEKFIKCHI